MSDQAAEGRHHLEKAYAQEESGDLVSALAECEIAIDLVPDLAEAHNLRGIVLDQQGRREQALDAYNEALSLDPDFHDARDNLDDLVGEIGKSSLLDAFRVAAWSALGFGVGFAIVGWVNSILPVSSPVVATVMRIVANGIAGALGGLSLGHALKSTRSPYLVLVGFVACGVGNFMISEIYWGLMIFVPVTLLSRELLDLGNLVTWVLLGGLIGTLLGVVQRDRDRILLIAVAGAIGFGLELFLFDPVFSLLMPMLAIFAEDNEAVRQSIFGLCYLGATGIVGGYCIGFAMGTRWPPYNK